MSRAQTHSRERKPRATVHVSPEDRLRRIRSGLLEKCTGHHTRPRTSPDTIRRHVFLLDQAARCYETNRLWYVSTIPAFPGHRIQPTDNALTPLGNVRASYRRPATTAAAPALWQRALSRPLPMRNRPRDAVQIRRRS